MKRLLLLSTSTVHGSGYLEYAEREIRDFLGGVSRVLFVPYALHDLDAYAARVRVRFTQIGIATDSLHEFEEAAKAILGAQAIFVGGGNTFRLLKALQTRGLLPLVRERVANGMPYMGSSAGSNIAAPTIRTTNDMPIVEPSSFEALGLVSFQINPHYLDPDPASKHMGETREERLVQFLEENDTPVIGLREGAILRIENDDVLLTGTNGARLFRKGEDAMELSAGSSLKTLLC